MTPLKRQVIERAKQAIGVREETTNWGRWIKVYLNFVGWFEPAPWCCAFVSYKVHQAARDLKLISSFPKTASCQAAYDWAKRTRRLLKAPMKGCVGVIYYPHLKRYGHIFFVVDVLANGDIITVEGNTNDDGSREGYEVAQKTRTVTASLAFFTIA